MCLKLDTAGLGEMGGQNPKSEIRNPKQIPMSKEANPQNQAAAGGLTGQVLRISHLNLVLVSDFEFRISDLSSQGSGVQPKRCGTCSPREGSWTLPKSPPAGHRPLHSDLAIYPKSEIRNKFQ